MKICGKCKNKKELKNFYPSKGYRDNFHPWCKGCYKVMIRNSYLKRTYGIDSDQYNEMLQAQDGGCAICLKKEDTFMPSVGKNKNLAVDHDEKTGKIRGILCENCNRGIGLLEHNIKLLNRAIEYLNQYKFF